MIIDKKDARKELLYTAYGYAVEGIKATYIYTYDGSNREEDCLTSLYITDVEGKEIYTYKGFNNPISCTCFEKNIDCFLWWIQHDTPGNYDIKKTFNDVFVNNRGIFSHRIIQMKQAEEKKEQERRKILERERTELEIFDYCLEHGLKLYKAYLTLYIMEFSDDKTEALFNKADASQLEKYIDFIRQTDTEQAKIVYSADLYNEDIKTIYDEIKALETA